MQPLDIAKLAAELKSLRGFDEVQKWRQSYSAEVRQAVITSEYLSEVERASLVLLNNFGAPSRYGHNGGWIVDPGDPDHDTAMGRRSSDEGDSFTEYPLTE